MDKISKIILFSIVLTLVVTMSLLFKFEIIGNAVFFTFLFLLIAVEIVSLIVSVGNRVKIGKTKSTIIKNGMRDVFDKINKELEQMPDNDIILWERGKNVVTKTREFLDSNGKTQRFIAMVARTKYSKREVIVYYNTTEDHFWDWDSDPSPQKLVDPFFKFEPYTRNNYGQRNIMDRYGKKKRSGFRIDFDGDNDMSSKDRNVDQFADSLDLDSKFKI